MMIFREIEPVWAASLHRQLNAQAAKYGRRDLMQHPAASAKALLRTVLAETLLRATEQHNHFVHAQIALWSRALPYMDSWMEAVDVGEREALMVAMASGPFGPNWSARETLSSAARIHGPNTAQRAAKESQEAILAAGVGPHIRRSIESAMRTMFAEEDARAGRDAVIAHVHIAASSLAIPAWESTIQLRGAVEVLDERLNRSLARLESQSHWLCAAGDPWQHPGAFAVMVGLQKVAAERAVFTACATISVWDAAGQPLRRQLLDAAMQIRDDQDNAATHAALAHIAERHGVQPKLTAALAGINWPKDSADRLLWMPPDGCVDEVGRLLMAMEARRFYAITRSMPRWRDACKEVEFIAGQVLACLDLE
ncbi:MAG: hypothetical protein P8J86_01540 [Phycisphaerales bacterium]|nr:hypothetical protein [Phycisphaerales bacterium]